MILCEAHSCFTALPHFPSPLDAVLNQHMIIQNCFYDDQTEINIHVLLAELMELQSKFEEDKKRLQQLRAARKFRPY
jgi:hypothetical protein